MSHDAWWYERLVAGLILLVLTLYTVSRWTRAS